MRRDMRFVVRELAELARMDVQVLRAKYREAFGQATTSRNATYLRRRLAWWIQWQAEDMFSERILARLAETPPCGPLARTTKRSLRSRKFAGWMITPERARFSLWNTAWSYAVGFMAATSISTSRSIRSMARSR